MPGALSTKTIKDGGGTSFTQRVWDESGTGAGPFQPVSQVAKSDGTVVDPDAIGGKAAHGAAIAGNPVRLAARAISSLYAALTNGQVADLVTTLVGALIIKPYSIPENDWSYAAANLGIVNTTVAVTIKAAAGVGLRNYITGLDITAEALGAATELAIRDGSGGVVLWRMKIGTGGLTQGLPIQFPSPLKSSANTLLEVVTLTASVTGAVYVNANGYIAP